MQSQYSHQTGFGHQGASPFNSQQPYMQAVPQRQFDSPVGQRFVPLEMMNSISPPSQQYLSSSSQGYLVPNYHQSSYQNQHQYQQHHQQQQPLILSDQYVTPAFQSVSNSSQQIHLLQQQQQSTQFPSQPYNSTITQTRTALSPERYLHHRQTGSTISRTSMEGPVSPRRANYQLFDRIDVTKRFTNQPQSMTSSVRSNIDFTNSSNYNNNNKNSGNTPLWAMQTNPMSIPLQTVSTAPTGVINNNLQYSNGPQTYTRQPIITNQDQLKLQHARSLSPVMVNSFLPISIQQQQPQQLQQLQSQLINSQQFQPSSPRSSVALNRKEKIFSPVKKIDADDIQSEQEGGGSYHWGNAGGSSGVAGDTASLRSVRSWKSQATTSGAFGRVSSESSLRRKKIFVDTVGSPRTMTNMFASQQQKRKLQPFRVAESVVQNKGADANGVGRMNARQAKEIEYLNMFSDDQKQQMQQQEEQEYENALREQMRIDEQLQQSASYQSFVNQNQSQFKMNESSGNDFNTVEARNVAGGNKKKSLVLEELEDDSNDYSPLGVLKEERKRKQREKNEQKQTKDNGQAQGKKPVASQETPQELENRRQMMIKGFFALLGGIIITKVIQVLLAKMSLI